MSNLDSVVLSVVEDFVKNEVLFTALDVSNKVKETLPFARHREVRDSVRNLFFSVMQPAGYNHTDIDVTLPDGTTPKAVLYHPLVDSWDLDNKYDAQKRAQTSAKSSSTVTDRVSTVSVTNVGVTVNTPNGLKLTAPNGLSVTPTPVVTSAQAQTNARDLWNQLFQSQPSLFPRK